MNSEQNTPPVDFSEAKQPPNSPDLGSETNPFEDAKADSLEPSREEKEKLVNDQLLIANIHAG